MCSSILIVLLKAVPVSLVVRHVDYQGYAPTVEFPAVQMRYWTRAQRIRLFKK